MRIEIEFHPDDGPMNLLYAEFTEPQLKQLREISGDNAGPDDAITIRAATTPGGSERNMLMRCWRIRGTRIIN